ncbi:MAG: hypothetical protein JST21_11950 [Bacteroidetes bacterium]|nr:hypothetical protein [Bacteroidota bacterium]
MNWKEIPKSEIPGWNEKLKATDAVFYQYPYYVASEYNSPLAKSLFIQYVEAERVVAYAAIIEIGWWFFKVGIIDNGPIVFVADADLKAVINDLKAFAKKRNYMHFQIRPALNSLLHDLIETDDSFIPKIFFPFHKKIRFDSNIYNKPEKELLAGFKLQGRRKIVLAGRVPFNFIKIDDNKALIEIRDLFKEVTEKKKYGFLPFEIYNTIYLEGKKYGLCDIYAAYLNDELVNFVLVTKDANSFYHYTSALRVKGYKANESPPAKLHFFVMQDCFYNEHKAYYNISYGGSEKLLRFKEYFNPVDIERPPYYTYIIKKGLVQFMTNFSSNNAHFLRKVFKRISKFHK